MGEKETKVGAKEQGAVAFLQRRQPLASSALTRASVVRERGTETPRSSGSVELRVSTGQEPLWGNLWDMGGEEKVDGRQQHPGCRGSSVFPDQREKAQRGRDLGEERGKRGSQGERTTPHQGTGLGRHGKEEEGEGQVEG